MILGVDGETVRFCLLEVTESLRHVLTPAEEKHPWTAPKWDYQLTGKLQFRVDNLPYFMGVGRQNQIVYGVKPSHAGGSYQSDSRISGSSQRSTNIEWCWKSNQRQKTSKLRP